MKTPIFYIYILECSNGKYYTGYTNDIKKRYADHLSGKASKFTRSFRPLRIAACWMLCGNKGDALKVEAIIKSTKRNVKEMLIKSPGKLKNLICQKLDIAPRIRKLSQKQLHQLPGRYS